MIAVQYKSPNGFFMLSEWLWNDKTYFDDDYSVLNARLGYQGKHVSFYLFGENLTNTEYFSFILPSFNAGSPAKPRSLGIRTSLKF